MMITENTMPDLIYLAGPMRGYPRYNFEEFESATLDLESRGVQVISPHRMDLALGFNPDLPIAQEFMESCVKRDVEAIISTEAVVFLPRWTSSTGAMAEYHIAKWLQRPCYQYPSLVRFNL